MKLGIIDAFFKIALALSLCVMVGMTIGHLLATEPVIFTGIVGPSAIIAAVFVSHIHIKKQIKGTMDSISTELDTIKTNLDTAITGIHAQNALIQSLQATIANQPGNTLTADAKAKLDALVAESAAAVAALPPPPVPVPAPVVTPPAPAPTPAPEPPAA